MPSAHETRQAQVNFVLKLGDDAVRSYNRLVQTKGHKQAYEYVRANFKLRDANKIVKRGKNKLVPRSSKLQPQRKKDIVAFILGQQEKFTARFIEDNAPIANPVGVGPSYIRNILAELVNQDRIRQVGKGKSGGRYVNLYLVNKNVPQETRLTVLMASMLDNQRLLQKILQQPRSGTNRSIENQTEISQHLDHCERLNESLVKNLDKISQLLN